MARSTFPPNSLEVMNIKPFGFLTETSLAIETN